MKLLSTITVFAVILASAATAASPRVVLDVNPASVAPGGVITISAASSPCLRRDQVILISTAFPGHAYGEGAVYGRVESHGAFKVRARIRSALRPGRFLVGVRCGGGNLGITATIRIS